MITAMATVVKNQMLEFVLGDGSGTFSLDKLKLHETFFFLSKILKLLIYKIYWKNMYKQLFLCNNWFCLSNYSEVVFFIEICLH